MGKFRSRNRDGEKKKPNEWNAARGGANYDIIVKENANFEKYYRQLSAELIADDAEFARFVDTLKQPLPITFRITSYKSYAHHVLDTLKSEHFKYLDEVTRGDDGERVLEASIKKGASLLVAQSRAKAAATAAASDESKENTDEADSVAQAAAAAAAAAAEAEPIYKCLPWYPGEMAWQVNLSRQDVRKNVHFDAFKQFLIHQTEYGYVSRQEAVSMIPPLLLDVQPEHKVLGKCFL